MGGAIIIKNKKKGELQVNALLRNQTARKVDAETGISGAGKQMEKMTKRIEALEKAIAQMTSQYNLLIAWKSEQDMKDVLSGVHDYE